MDVKKEMEPGTQELGKRGASSLQPAGVQGSAPWPAPPKTATATPKTCQHLLGNPYFPISHAP